LTIEDIGKRSEAITQGMQEAEKLQPVRLAAFQALILGDYDNGSNEKVLLDIQNKLHACGIGASLLRDYEYPKLGSQSKFSIATPKVDVIVLVEGTRLGTAAETGRLTHDERLLAKTILAYVGEKKDQHDHHRPFKMRICARSHAELIEDVVQHVKNHADAYLFGIERSSAFKSEQSDNSDAGGRGGGSGGT